MATGEEGVVDKLIDVSLYGFETPDGTRDTQGPVCVCVCARARACVRVGVGVGVGVHCCACMFCMRVVCLCALVGFSVCVLLFVYLSC